MPDEVEMQIPMEYIDVTRRTIINLDQLAERSSLLQRWWTENNVGSPNWQNYVLTTQARAGFRKGLDCRAWRIDQEDIDFSPRQLSCRNLPKLADTAKEKRNEFKEERRRANIPDVMADKDRYKQICGEAVQKRSYQTHLQCLAKCVTNWQQLEYGYVNHRFPKDHIKTDSETFDGPVKTIKLWLVHRSRWMKP